MQRTYSTGISILPEPRLFLTSSDRLKCHPTIVVCSPVVGLPHRTLLTKSTTIKKTQNSTDKINMKFRPLEVPLMNRSFALGPFVSAFYLHQNYKRNAPPNWLSESCESK